MGTVYKARHALLRRPTAVKLLNPEMISDTAIARFEREVQLTSGLTHPNTVAIYDYGRTASGVFYYAMEYLEGINLDELVKRFGPLPEARAVYVLRQVCASLAEAHAAGLVHRDIKPANIILTFRGGLHDFVKVLDFGLAKLAGDLREPALTSANVVAGTPHYVAPEAVTRPDQIDARCGRLCDRGRRLLPADRLARVRRLFGGGHLPDARLGNARSTLGPLRAGS